MTQLSKFKQEKVNNVRHFWAIFLIVPLIVLFFAFPKAAFAVYPTYTASTTTSIVGPYDPAVAGGGNIGGSATYRYFLTDGQKYRIR